MGRQNFAWINFYRAWEFYWPADVTYGGMRQAANEEQSMERTPVRVKNEGRVCSNCKHSREHFVTIAITQVHCMRYPRTVIGGLVPSPQGPAVISAAVDNIIDEPDNRWCGEFAPRAQG